MHTKVGQQVGRFAPRGDRTLFFFVFAETSRATPDDIGAQKRLVRQRFGQNGWECPQILSALDSAKDLYFDRVSQITMGSEGGLSWTRGRVSLVGDAAWCVSLLAGQGSAIAMAGAYILAGELHRAAGDHKTAFARSRINSKRLLRESNALRLSLQAHSRRNQQFLRSCGMAS